MLKYFYLYRFFDLRFREEIMAVTRALENYLETILILNKAKDGVHATDICAALGYSRPTVSDVVHQMLDKGLIIIDSSNHITLTEAGRAIAEPVYERHTVLTELLIKIGVSKQTAQTDACRIEHEISDETFSCIKKLLEKN